MCCYEQLLHNVCLVPASRELTRSRPVDIDNISDTMLMVMIKIVLCHIDGWLSRSMVITE